MNRVGGSARVRSELTQAFAEARGVTAKIRWLTRPDDDGEGEGRGRWIHCTPLLGHTGAVGVWMVVLVDEEGGVSPGEARRRFRDAPPVSSFIGGKTYDSNAARERKETIGTYATAEQNRYALGRPSGPPGGQSPQIDRNKASQILGGQNKNRSKVTLNGDDGATRSAPASELSFALK